MLQWESSQLSPYPRRAAPPDPLKTPEKPAASFYFHAAASVLLPYQYTKMPDTLLPRQHSILWGGVESSHL